jgi:hypothetical protein
MSAPAPRPGGGRCSEQTCPRGSEEGRRGTLSLHVTKLARGVDQAEADRDPPGCAPAGDQEGNPGRPRRAWTRTCRRLLELRDSASSGRGGQRRASTTSTAERSPWTLPGRRSAHGEPWSARGARGPPKVISWALPPSTVDWLRATVECRRSLAGEEHNEEALARVRQRLCAAA